MGGLVDGLVHGLVLFASDSSGSVWVAQLQVVVVGIAFALMAGGPRCWVPDGGANRFPSD